MFSIARFSEQFRILVRQNLNRHGLVLGIFVLLQMFVQVLYFNGFGGMDEKSFYKIAMFLSIILCVLACQDVFNRLRNTPSGIQYLMTPASMTEKYAASWVYSALFIFLVVQSAFVVFQLIGMSIGNLITGMGSGYGIPEWIDIWDIFKAVLLTHSIFFLGSLVFKKNPIIKTIATYMGINFLFSLIFMIIAGIYFHNFKSNGPENFQIIFNNHFGNIGDGTPFTDFLEFIVKNIEWFLGCLTVIFWAVSYRILIKKQI